MSYALILILYPSDVSEDEQKLLPRSLHLVFKLITSDYNMSSVANTSLKSVKDNVTSTIEEALDFNIKQILILDIR